MNPGPAPVVARAAERTAFGWTASIACDHHEEVLRPVRQALSRHGARRVLDVGSGNGSFTHRLRHSGFDVVGLEPDEDGVALAGEWGGDFRQGSVYDEPGPDLGTFDAVVCVEVIEHLIRPAAVPRFARKVLRPGGVLVITTPHHGYAKNLLISLCGGWDEHHEPLHDGGHIKFFSAATMRRMLVDEGFCDIEVSGAGRFAPLWRSMIVVARLGPGQL